MIVNLLGQYRALLNQERAALLDFHALLNRLDADDADLKNIKIAMNDLDGVFMLVVCGEYNAGKSSLLNALLGDKVMLEGSTPTTDRVTILSYGPVAKDVAESESLMRREYPAEALKDIAFVDTPGTNAIVQEHQELTEDFIPRSDLVLFVTSADRPFTESERKFLELIGSWGKKIIILINKLDIIDDAEKQKVLDFVRENARKTIGVEPQVFGVQAKAALAAKQASDDSQLADTGLSEVQAFIETHLVAGERLKLKLLNSIGVAQNLNNRYEKVIEERLNLLKDDRETLEEVDRQVSQYDKTMKRDVANYLARIKTVLIEVERRGYSYFDDTIRLRNIYSLLQSDRIKQDFEMKVVRGADREIDLAVRELADWFLQKNLSLWEDVMVFVNQRRKASQEQIMGEVGGHFQYDRDSLIDHLQESASDALESYNESEAAGRLADQLQNAVYNSGLGIVGGVGLGAALAAFLPGAMLDITGITLGLTVASVSLFTIPRRRARAKQEIHQTMQSLRDGLQENIGKEFEVELRKASEKLHIALEPYTRFIKTKIDRLESLQSELSTTKLELSRLRGEIEALTVD